MVKLALCVVILFLIEYQIQVRIILSGNIRNIPGLIKDKVYTLSQKCTNKT